MNLYKKITVADAIEYQWVDKTPGGSNLGRAEFIICPVYKHGELCSLFINAFQQRREEKQWQLNIEQPGITQFQINSWTHKTEHPNIWYQGWCKEHDTIFMRVYTPRDTSKITFSYHFGTDINITFE